MLEIQQFKRERVRDRNERIGIAGGDAKSAFI